MTLIEEAILNFSKNKIKLTYFEDIEIFYKYLDNLIKLKQTVGVGDSVSFE